MEYKDTIFLPKNLNDKLEITKNRISKYINQHHQRWGQGYINWNSEIARIKQFADSRVCLLYTSPSPRDRG